MADDSAAANEAKERRKQLRRDRIARINNDDAASNQETSSSPNDEAMMRSESITNDASDRLAKLQASSINLVTEFRVKTDQREATRRDEEDEDNQKRDELLKQVADPRADDEVESGWKQCLEATNVQDLCEMLDKQKTTCEAALSKLERVGVELTSELREKDHEYVYSLKRNRQEIELMQQCIAEEHLRLKEAFDEELKLIEESLVADRNYILNTNKDELEALIAKREGLENGGLERQRKTIDEHSDGITEGEAKGEQDREDLKKRLEAEVRRLEIELEDTKARHQFDTDKLEYNVRLLTELSENEEAVKKQKRRIMKGKEELNRESSDRHQSKTKGIRENDLLEGDCERIEKQSSGLTEKFERFKISDDEKYRAVLGMHKDDLQKLQCELKQSQDFIFDGTIGCCETKAEQSCTSDVTWAEDNKSNKTNEGKIEADDSYSSDFTSAFSKSFDKSNEWKQAETLMSKHRNVLERREGLNSEVASMGLQNVGLEKKLSNRLTEKVNDELVFSPSNAISVGN